jgi:hypothetical protein
MRSNISRRLKLLEQKAHIHGTPQPVIFVRFVSPGQPCKSNRAECDGQVWERMAHETPQDFERRIRENLQRHEDGASVVIFFPEKRTEDQRMSENYPLNSREIKRSDA